MPQGTLSLAVEVHDQLLRVVAPATPVSIRASSLALSRNPALYAIVWVAAVSFFIFLIPTGIALIWGNTAPPDTTTDPLLVVSILGAAGLGSSFYALHTASRYITSGTFDPKYNNYYLIRLGLGVLSGVILALFLNDLLGISAAGDDPGQRNLSKVGVPALALIGGYASQAVAQILDRVAETLVTLVSGGGQDKIEAAKQQAAADAEKKITQHSVEVLKKLQSAVTDPNPVVKVQAILDELAKTK